MCSELDGILDVVRDTVNECRNDGKNIRCAYVGVIGVHSIDLDPRLSFVGRV
jgi:hypothetical protein